MANDTIAAVATPAGRGGIAVIRISGPRVNQIAEVMVGGVPAPRQAKVKVFYDIDGQQLDHGICVFFPAPHSYTGEDVLELHGHGGVVIVDMVLRSVLTLGARLARPGEFSERAFLNGKLDLAQAEAIADLIDSSSESAARSALRSLQGEFSRRVHSIVEAVTNLRAHVEAAIDFPEEEVDFLDDRRLQEQLLNILHDLDELRANASQGRLLRDGLHVVLAGPPNAGKSSLLNALSGAERAIVSPTPGTTRDTVEQSIQIDGLPIHLTDTAGLRTSDDNIEQEGVRRAHNSMRQSDHVLLIVDDNQEQDLGAIRNQLATAIPVTIVYNKIDLSGRAPGMVPGQAALSVSAVTSAGLPELRQHLKTCAGYQQPDSSTFIARRRHLDALDRSRSGLQVAQRQLTDARAGEVVAEELRLVQQHLGEITGIVSADDLLGRIFASFCIGK